MKKTGFTVSEIVIALAVIGVIATFVTPMVARLFPDLTVISAHFGGYHRWDELDVYDGLQNVYYDTCSAMFMLSPERATEIMRKLGVDRFFFSSDYPMWDHEEELENIMRLGLTEDEREMVLYKNAERVLGI